MKDKSIMEVSLLDMKIPEKVDFTIGVFTIESQDDSLHDDFFRRKKGKI